MFRVSGQFENDTLILAPFRISHSAPDRWVEGAKMEERGFGQILGSVYGWRGTVHKKTWKGLKRQVTKWQKSLRANFHFSLHNTSLSSGLALLSIFLERFMQQRAISQCRIKPCVGKICKDWMDHSNLCIMSNANTLESKYRMYECPRMTSVSFSQKQDTVTERHSSCKQSSATHWWVSGVYE